MARGRDAAVADHDRVLGGDGAEGRGLRVVDDPGVGSAAPHDSGGAARSRAGDEGDRVPGDAADLPHAAGRALHAIRRALLPGRGDRDHAPVGAEELRGAGGAVRSHDAVRGAAVRARRCALADGRRHAGPPGRDRPRARGHPAPRDPGRGDGAAAALRLPDLPHRL